MALIRVPGQRVVIATESGATGLDIGDERVDLGASIHMGGMPIADGLRSSRIEVVSGVIRQNPSTPAQWAFIQDSGHVQNGFNDVYGDATAEPPNGNLHALSGALYVKFAKTYSRVISLIVAPDETLAYDYGVTCGASVGVDQITIRAKVTRGIAGAVRFDGTNWVISMGEFQGVAPSVSYNSTTGALTVDHSNEFVRGLAIHLTPWFTSSQVPYLPVIRTGTTNSSFAINWIDTTTGAIVTGAASQRMACFFSKRMSSAARLDGVSGWDAVPFHTGGNLWIYGIMEL